MEDTPLQTTERRSRPSIRILAMLAAVAVGAFALDQFTKAVVVSSMTEGQTIEALGGFLQWHFVRNPGAAFSFAAGSTWIFTGVSTLMVIVIIVVARRLGSKLWAAVFGLVLGGALGNLFDRLFREPGFGTGHVIDFIYTPWMLPAIYNVADMCIVVGMSAFVLLTLFDIGFDGKRRPKAKKDA